ncbi:hypothetical protein EDB84DRAFT_1674531 [Lactarius hengduanensis]|nr:hypothetical protein EDB84DRAFT_1674531 [Lactarius hengduanensis]
MSNKDYYGSQQAAGYPQQQQQQYYPPSGPPPGQGYYPQQPQQPQQAYQQGYSGQPGFQQQAQPQAVYVQQPPPKKDSGFCAACLTGVCLCCCAEGAKSEERSLSHLRPCTGRRKRRKAQSLATLDMPIHTHRTSTSKELKKQLIASIKHQPVETKGLIHASQYVDDTIHFVSRVGMDQRHPYDSVINVNFWDQLIHEGVRVEVATSYSDLQPPMTLSKGEVGSKTLPRYRASCIARVDNVSAKCVLHDEADRRLLHGGGNEGRCPQGSNSAGSVIGATDERSEAARVSGALGVSKNYRIVVERSGATWMRHIPVLGEVSSIPRCNLARSAEQYHKATPDDEAKMR